MIEETVDYEKLPPEQMLPHLLQLGSQIKTLEQTIAGQNELISILQKHSVRSRQLAEMVHKIDVRHLDTIEETATREVAELFGAERAALFLVDRDKVLLALKRGFPKSFKCPPLDLVNDSDVLLIHALRQEGAPVIFHSISTYELECGCEFRPHPSDSFFEDGGGMLCPLHYSLPEGRDSEIVGLLALSGGKFTKEDLSEASLVSEIMATTLSNYFLLEKMSMLAETDGLTELFNHRHFQQEITRAIASFSRYRTPFSLIMLDIDHFKEVNDTYMHQTGDLILRDVSRIIRQNLRDNVDIASRYGGEEFALILPQTGLEGALIVAKRLRQSVENHRFGIGSESIGITISVGVVEYREGMGKGELIDLADKAMYKAKSEGRNRVCSAQ